MIQNVTANVLNTQCTLYCLSDSVDEEVGYFRSDNPWVKNSFWVWKNEGNSILFKVENDSKIVNFESGYYIVLVQIPGCGSGNSGYSEFVVNGSTIVSSFSNSSDGNINMIHFTKVLYLPAYSCIQIKNNSINHAWNMGQKLATQFTIYRMYK